MKKSTKILNIAVAFVASAALSGCNHSMDVIPDARAFLGAQEGPKLDGVNATLLKAAQDAEASGDYTTAANFYQQLVDKDPQNIGYALSLAENVRRRGEYDRAIGMYNQILAREATSSMAQEGRALAFVSKGDLELAEQPLNALIQSGGATWRSFNALGIISASRGNAAQAESLFQQAQALSPNNPSILNNTGLALALSRNFDAAIATLSQASAIAAPRPNFKRQIDLNTAMVFAASGKLDSAEAIARQYFEGPTLSNNMAFYSHLANDDQLAKTYLSMALTESKRFYARAWKNLQGLNTKEPQLAIMPQPTPSVGSIKLPEFAAASQPAPPAPALALPAPSAPVALTPPPEPLMSESIPAQLNAMMPASGQPVEITPLAAPVMPAPLPEQPLVVQQQHAPKRGTMESVGAWVDDMLDF